MAATLKDVQRWIEEGKKKGATHLISVCDTFDWEDYPVYVMPNEDIDIVKKRFTWENMQKINEVIKLKAE